MTTPMQLHAPGASTAQRAIATLHAMRLRRLMGWEAIKIWSTRDEAVAARHNLGAAMANANVALPPGWDVAAWTSTEHAHCLAIYNDAGTRLMLV